MTQHCGLLRTEQGGPHIHVAAPSIATILDNLATVLGEYHAVLDLTDAFFFSFQYSPDSCDTTVTLPYMGETTMDPAVAHQGYMHSLTICHRMTVQISPSSPFPHR